MRHDRDATAYDRVSAAQVRWGGPRSTAPTGGRRGGPLRDPAEHAAFVASVAGELPSPELDYVRLNMRAHHR